MITRELAKELQEAGFPKLGHGGGDECKNCYYFPGKSPICTPTLEELIEAIFESHLNISFEMGGMNTWWAVARDLNYKAIAPVQTEKTPIEAVARLWLALNKK